MKNVSSFFAIFFLLISLGYQGCNQGPGASIEAILNQCAKDSKKVHESKMGAMEAAYYVSNRMQSMDVSSCPKDFQVAFKKHIKAWRAVADHLAHPVPIEAVVVDEATFQASGNALPDRNSNPFSFPPPEEDVRAFLYGAVNSTYLELASIAEKYGANVPTSVIQK